MVNTIFILDKNMNVIDVLSNNGDSPKSPFFNDKYIQEMNTGAETFEFDTISNDRTSKYIVAGNYVAFKYKDKVKVFQIIETNEEHSEGLYKSCYCEIAGLELINNVVRPREIASANVRQFMEIALSDTSWKLGIVDASINSVHTIKIDKPINVYSFIQNNLSLYNMEIEYRFEMSHNKIIGKYIDVYRERGKKTRKRFEYGVNVSGVSKREDRSELVTALIGIGSNNIDFKSVEGTYPIIKPLNQDFVADEEAYKIWSKNGSHILGTFETNTESPHELLQLTWQELQRRKQPKFTYEINTEMIQGDDEEINIGDTVYVIDNDYSPAIHLSARVGKLEISFTDHTQNKCVLTNFKDVKSGILSLETIQSIIDGKFPIGSDQILDGAITEGKIDTEYLHTIKTDVLIAAKVEAEELIADKANIKDLEVINASIENLKATDVTISGKLTAADAEIKNLKSENVQVNGKLEATYAEIEKLKAVDIDVSGKLTAVEGDIGILNSNVANVSGKLTATEAEINLLKSDVAEIDTLLAGNITGENIQGGSITAHELASGTITAGSGVIADGAIGNAEISSLDASKVNAGTIDTSKVTVAGPNSNLKMSGNRLQVFTGIGPGQVERVSLGDVNGDGSKYGLLIRGADGKTVIMDENGVTNAGITNGSITNDKINSNANIDGAKLNINSVITKINEDGSESIQGAKIDIDGTNLSTKLSTITTTQTAQGNKITEHSSKIAANESAINLKVDSQTYESDKQNINSTLSKHTSEISAMKDSIALKVEKSDITNAINNLVIGGRNYIKNSKSVYMKPNGTNNYDLTFSISDNFWENENRFGVVTLSFDVESDAELAEDFSSKIWFRATPWHSFAKWTYPKGTVEKKHYVLQINLKNMANSYKTTQLFVRFQAKDTIGMRFTNVKMEISDKVTDWTPAPEDMSSEIDTKVNAAKAEIKVTTDKISQNVSNLTTKVNNKADGTTVTALSNKIGSLETSVNGISGTVSSLETTVTNKADASSVYTKKEVDSQTAEIKATTDAISQKVSSVESTTTSLNTKVNQAQNTADSKAKIFTSTPTVPYKVGDLWTAGPSGELMRCKTARSSGSYTASDWEKASKYTDDTKANAVDGKVNNLQTDYNSTKSKVSSIETNLNGITQRVSSTEKNVTTITNTANTANSNATNALNTANSANSKIDGLEIGGRNLLLNTDFISGKTNWSNSHGCLLTILSENTSEIQFKHIANKCVRLEIVSNQQHAFLNQTRTLESDTYYTVSAWVYGEVSVNINPYYNNNGWVGIGTNVSTTSEQFGKWTRLSCIFKPNKAYLETVITIGLYNKKLGDVCFVTLPQLEKGTKTTDWTPAPEDVQTQIDANKTEISSTKSKVSTIETNLNGITSRVSAVETNQTTTGNKVTSLESWKKEAEQKITETAITNTVKKNFYTKSETDSQITSKGYQTASQVQQTVNGLQVKVSQSGGYNLLLNSGFKNDMSSWNIQSHNNPTGGSIGFLSHTAEWAFPNPGVKTCQIRLSNQSDKEYGIKQSFKTTIGKKYTVSFYYAAHRVPLANVIVRGTSTSDIGGWLAHRQFNPSEKRGGNSTISNWGKYSITFTARLTQHILDIVINKSENDGYMWIAEPMIEEGEIANPYSQNPSEVYDGITTIDKDGIKISMQDGEGSQGYTRIAHDGMEIFNGNGSRMAHFGDNNTAYIKSLTADEIINDKLLKMSTGGTRHLYVAPTATGDGTGRDANNRANSITNALEWFRKQYGCYRYQSDIQIHLAGGDYWGANNYIGGWVGSGVIHVIFDQWACLRSTLRIEDNTMAVIVKGCVDPFNIEVQDNAYLYMSGDNIGIHIRNSSVVVAGLNLQQEGWRGDTNVWDNYKGVGIHAEYGSRVLVTNCDIVGWWFGCRVADSSYLSIQNCVGHVGCGGTASNGGIISIDRAMPICKDLLWRNIGGHILDPGGTWMSNSKFAPKPESQPTPPPAPTPTWRWVENTFWATSLRTTPEGSGSGTSARNGQWGQGKWGSYKPHRGFASFSGINAWCNGGRNFTVELTMTRLNTSHGVAGATPVPKIKTTSGSFWNCGKAFARGATHTVTLPSDVANALVTGGWTQLEMWAGTSTNDYSFYDNVSLKIRCEKQV